MGLFDWFRGKSAPAAPVPEEPKRAPASRLRGSEEARKAAAQIKVVASRLANEQLSGDYHSVFKGQGLAFEEVRAYQPGDDVRFIEWNVTARTGIPHVKVFREEREMTVLMVVDRSRGMTFGTVGRSKSQLASVIAGAISFTAIKNNDRVGLVLFTDEVEKVVQARKGSKHVLRVISDTLNHVPRSSGTDIGRALDAVGGLSRRRAAVFVLSDFIPGPSRTVARKEEELPYERSLRLLAARHDVVPIVVSDPREESLPDVGLVPFEDLETGEMELLDTSDRAVRDAFRRETARQKAARDSLFKRLGLDHIAVSTGKPFMVPLADFFRRRAQRMRYA